MKEFNCSVSKTSPDLKNASLFLVKPLPNSRGKTDSYGLLTRAVGKQLKPKRKKKAPETIYLSPPTHDHNPPSLSLGKLVAMSQEKNDEIRRHIKEKADLEGRNQELKLMLLNPTLREHELHQKIHRLEEEVRSLKRQLEEKDIYHREEVQRLKEKHLEQLKERHFEQLKEKQLEQHQKPQYQTYSNARGIEVVSQHRGQSPPAQYSSGSKIPEVKEASRGWPQTQYRPSEGTSYSNVFSSQAARSQNSPPKEAYRTDMQRHQQEIHKPSPNSSNNTTSQTANYKTNSYSANPPNSQSSYQVKTQSNEQSSYQSKQTGSPEYRNVPLQAQNARPVSFAGEGTSLGGTGTGVSSADIDNIYKRYYLNDQ